MNWECEVKNVRGHYEIFVSGKFYCSCDTLTEVEEELTELDLGR